MATGLLKHHPGARYAVATVVFSVNNMSPPARGGNGNSVEAKAGTARTSRADPALAALFDPALIMVQRNDPPDIG